MDKFTRAYIECAFWSSMDDNDEPLDTGGYELSLEARSTMIENCANFQKQNKELLYQAYDSETVAYNDEQAGHDFWLTRNRHGAGFWARGLGEVGQKLTDMAHAYGEVDLYIGDDGLIYHS